MSVPDWMIDATNMPKAQALETLAKELPEGWNVQITVENGGYDVTLFDPADNMTEMDSGDGPEGDMLEALRYAKWRNANDGVAVDKAWKRFQAAMSEPMPSNTIYIPDSQDNPQIPTGEPGVIRRDVGLTDNTRDGGEE